MNFSFTWAKDEFGKNLVDFFQLVRFWRAELLLKGFLL